MPVSYSFRSKEALLIFLRQFVLHTEESKVHKVTNENDAFVFIVWFSNYSRLSL